LALYIYPTMSFFLYACVDVDGGGGSDGGAIDWSTGAVGAANCNWNRVSGQGVFGLGHNEGSMGEGGRVHD
jgi:hypothetical protein